MGSCNSSGGTKFSRRRMLQLSAGLVGAMLLPSVLPSVVLGQTRRYDIQYLGRDEAAQVDRYKVTIGWGASLWDVATTSLIQISLDEGDQAAYNIIEAGFRQTYPDKPVTQLQPEDTFVFEVPAGTFVSSDYRRQGATVEFVSFRGDRLLYYPTSRVITYRLYRQESPEEAEVLLSESAYGRAVDLAKQVYEVDPPDFIQVRMIRSVLLENVSRLKVHTSRKYLDEFRNYRERAVAREPGQEGLAIYHFDPADPSVPFIRVDDAVGDEWDAGKFPTLFRVEYFKTGMVKVYRIVQPGDLLAVLNKPKTEEWRKIILGTTDWQEGKAEQLRPFSPAVTEIGSLVPGRILVLIFAPKPPRPTSRLGEVTCLGIPLAMVAGAGLVRRLGLLPPGDS